MIYEISRELQTALTAKGVPFAVVYGPEALDSTTPVNAERIVVDDTDDSDEPPMRVGGNPAARYLTKVGFLVRVYVNSAPLARIGDYRDRARDVADHVRACLFAIAQQRRQPLALLGGKFLSAEELNLRGLKVWSGAVYELRCTIARAVFDNTWTEPAAPTGAVTGLSPKSGEMDVTIGGVPPVEQLS